MKNHDYAGGGQYFVTICAHREFIAAAKGHPFGGAVGATSMLPKSTGASVGATSMLPKSNEDQLNMAPMNRAPLMVPLLGERMRITAEKCPYMRWHAHVVMPDHFHALISIEGGQGSLGDVVGGFKAAVSRNLRSEGLVAEAEEEHARLQQKKGVPPTRMRIWHRNYYEMIVRSAEMEQNISQYIRMNPWKCVQNLGEGLRGMGNPTLWHAEKLAVLSSLNAPNPKSIPRADVYLSGFHSPLEKEILSRLLKHKQRVIYCPAWGLGSSLHPDVLEALEDNRMLILEMTNREGNLAAAEQRNRFVLEHADRHWLPHVRPNGMLDKLVRELKIQL